MESRTDCPINEAVEVLGDRWSLLVLRDIIFEDRRHFRALLLGSAEGIASNILADRIARLIDAGLLTRGKAGRGQRALFSLTEAGIRTLPIIVAMGDWGLDWRPGDAVATARQRYLREQGADFVAELMEDLRVRHLDGVVHPESSGGPLERLIAATTLKT